MSEDAPLARGRLRGGHRYVHAGRSVIVRGACDLAGDEPTFSAAAS